MARRKMSAGVRLTAALTRGKTPRSWPGGMRVTPQYKNLVGLARAGKRLVLTPAKPRAAARELLERLQKIQDGQVKHVQRMEMIAIDTLKSSNAIKLFVDVYSKKIHQDFPEKVPTVQRAREIVFRNIATLLGFIGGETTSRWVRTFPELKKHPEIKRLGTSPKMAYLHGKSSRSN